MHIISIIGQSVEVTAPGNKTYTFKGYGNYDIEFKAEEVEIVCAILEANKAKGTSSSLTDCILRIREAAKQLPN